MTESPIITAAILRARQEQAFRDNPDNKDATRRIVRLSRKKRKTGVQWNILSTFMSQVTLDGHDVSPSSVRALFIEALDSEK